VHVPKEMKANSKLGIKDVMMHSSGNTKAQPCPSNSQAYLSSKQYTSVPAIIVIEIMSEWTLLN
jgi:hypothetical protein